MPINRGMEKHTVEYSYNIIPITENKLLIHAIPPMNLKNMLSERRQMQKKKKNTYCIMPFTQNVRTSKANQ